MRSSQAAGPAVHFLISHSHFGGAQELWANLAQGCLERGYEAKLLALYPDEEGEQDTPADLSWSYVSDVRPRRPLGVIRLVRSLAALLRKDGAEVVITALPAANVIAPVAVALSGLHARVVTTHHTPSFTYQRALDRADAVTGSLPSVKHILCVSDAVASSLHAKPAAYRQKLVTVRNAVPPVIEGLLARLSVRRREEGFDPTLIVCSGRLAPQKNFEVVVKALAYLPETVRLVIMGSGPEEGMLRGLAHSIGVAHRVKLLGQRSREETLSFVAGGALFVQMSRFEGNSLSLIEAAKIGIPLIVSDAPEQIEGITDASGRLCGVVAPMHDHRVLAAEVERVLDDRRAYSRLADASAMLGMEIQFSKLIEQYLRLAELPAPAR